MILTPQTPVGDIVRENVNAAIVLTWMHIDYCCHGNQTLSEACMRAGADIDKVMLKLEHAFTLENHERANVQKKPPDELCDYIIRQHHHYIREHIPVLTTNIEKLCNVHGHIHPELLSIRELFHATSYDLVQHMQEEEMILFSYIKHMAVCSKNGEVLHTPAFGTVVNPIRLIVAEHRDEAGGFQEINKITGHYAIPGDACDTFMVTYKMLDEFEQDLHWHFHLENNVLFPQAREMESRLLRK